MRNAGVDAMVLDWIQTLRKRSQAPVRVPRSRVQAKKRKAKRKAQRKARPWQEEVVRTQWGERPTT